MLDDYVYLIIYCYGLHMLVQFHVHKAFFVFRSFYAYLPESDSHVDILANCNLHIFRSRMCFEFSLSFVPF